MARHRGHDMRRTVSPGLIWAAVAVVAIVTAAIVWVALGNRSDKQGDEAAGKCAEGPASITVASDRGLTDTLKSIAAQYNETKPIVRDHCVSVSVAAKDAKVVLDGLTGTWETASLGPAPAIWIPQSSVWTSQLIGAKPASVSGAPRSLATSPVVLAVAADAKTALDGKVGWSELPELQRTSDSLAEKGLDGWGSLRLAMPTGPMSDATYLAAQAIAAGITRSPELSAQTADRTEVSTALERVLSGAPTTPDGSNAGGIELLTRPSAQRAPVHAVPITEQQLFAATKGQPDPDVAALVPTGATPVADYPVALLSGNQLTDAQTAAASEFADYLRGSGRLDALTALGYRVGDTLPKPAGAVSFPQIRTQLATPTAPTQNTITSRVTKTR